MDQIENDRFFTMAETFNVMAPLLVPMYDLLQNEIFNIITTPFDKEITVIDLGAGSGILLEKILNKFPNSKCVWVDYSEDFKKIAEDRLCRFKNRVQFVLSPMENNWMERVESSPEIIVSMSAIHHLESEEKRTLYLKCYDMLNCGGWFLNIDEMRTLFADGYKKSMQYWVNYVNDQEKIIPENKRQFFKKWKNHFDNWKIRNVDNFETPKLKGDDLHDSFLDQVNWLNDIGFKNVDVFMKYHLWSIIGGQK
jgi:ubiquinone/menaquinone biosynthesis C-methylase UbiE